MVIDDRFGYVHVCYGEGVGKTTRAVGLAIRAAGGGLNVAFVQFMKPGMSDEVKIFNKIPNIQYFCPGEHPFILSKGPGPVHFKHAESALEAAWKAVGDSVHILVCDEILDTLLFGTLTKDSIIDLMHRCQDKTELIMTGRHAPCDIVEEADYVTKFVQIKHPYYKGVRARGGIEY